MLAKSPASTPARMNLHASGGHTTRAQTSASCLPDALKSSRRHVPDVSVARRTVPRCNVTNLECARVQCWETLRPPARIPASTSARIWRLASGGHTTRMPAAACSSQLVLKLSMRPVRIVLLGKRHVLLMSQAQVIKRKN